MDVETRRESNEEGREEGIVSFELSLCCPLLLFSSPLSST